MVAGWELFPEQFREVATQPFRLLGVGEKELEGGKYVVRSDIIVPVQRASQVVMARCADCLVYLASVGPRAILGLPFFARYGLVAYRIRDALLWWRTFVKAAHGMNLIINVLLRRHGHRCTWRATAGV